MMNKNIAAMALLFLVSVPFSVLATEGALEINQACVADGCFPGDTAGFPVTIAARGNYQLTSNLTLDDTDQTAIQVNSDNVVIDMKGFGVFGPNVCTGVQDECTSKGGGKGISSSTTRRNIIVRDGIIRGMGHSGINIGEQSMVEGVVTEHNWRVGIFVRAGSTVRNSNANFNGYLGMEAHESRLTDCSVADNGQVGFAVGDSIVTRVVARTSPQTGLLDWKGSQIHDSNFSENGSGIESINGATTIFNSTMISNNTGVMARGSKIAEDDPLMPVLLSGNTIVSNTVNQLGGAGTFVELGTNYCGTDTTCP